MKALKNSLREILRYPSAIAGLTVVLFFVVVSIYAMISIPYSKAIALWRGGEDAWYQNPKFVPPTWINFFRKEKLPVSFHANSAEGGMEKVVTVGSGDTSEVKISYTFDFEADAYPQE
jgi:peptide/nickel transport system permease protein